MLRFRDHLRANESRPGAVPADEARAGGADVGARPALRGREVRGGRRDHAPRDVNRLANETSPYLLQHADNPVDWYPWGEEALARARDEDRPILLSIGYSACHWCHVMEHESFEDEATAAAHERALRQRQGRPRGTARPRLGLHGRGRHPDRPRRLADDRLPHPRGRAVLRRHVLPAGTAPRPAELPPGARGGRRRVPRPPRGRRALGPPAGRRRPPLERAAALARAASACRCSPKRSAGCARSSIPSGADSAARRSSRPPRRSSSSSGETSATC